MDPNDFDLHQEERLWPTTDEPETWDDGPGYDPDGYDPDEDFGLEDDGDALASAGFGTDEDYGSEDNWLDGSYEE